MSTGELPDWLRDLDLGPYDSDEEKKEPAQPHSEDAAAVPEWLRNLVPDPGAEESPAPTAAGAEEDLPEWLRGTASTPSPTPQSAGAEELPSWLKGAGSAGPTDNANVPEWMQELKPGAKPNTAAAAPGAAENENIPDWLRELAPGSAPRREPPPPESPAPRQRHAPPAAAPSRSPEPSFQAESTPGNFSNWQQGPASFSQKPAESGAQIEDEDDLRAALYAGPAEPEKPAAPTLPKPAPRRKRRKNGSPMAQLYSWQRFVLSFLLFVVVALAGFIFLVVLQRIYLF